MDKGLRTRTTGQQLTTDEQFVDISSWWWSFCGRVHLLVSAQKKPDLKFEYIFLPQKVQLRDLKCGQIYKIN